MIYSYHQTQLSTWKRTLVPWHTKSHALFTFLAFSCVVVGFRVLPFFRVLAEYMRPSNMATSSEQVREKIEYGCELKLA